MWLLHIEQMDGCRIMHARNGREYRPPELPKYSVDGYCPETKIMYEFLGCFYHGRTCQPFRDVKMMGGDTLAEIYERTITRIEQITQAGLQFTSQLKCEFDEAGIVNQKPELPTHPIVEQWPLHNRNALYGGRTEGMRLHYKARENETVQYVYVMSLYPFFANITSFQSAIPTLKQGTRVSNWKHACRWKV